MQLDAWGRVAPLALRRRRYRAAPRAAQVQAERVNGRSWPKAPVWVQGAVERRRLCTAADVDLRQSSRCSCAGDTRRVITLAGRNWVLGRGQNEDTSNYRAGLIMFNLPSVGPVSFATFQLPPIEGLFLQ